MIIYKCKMCGGNLNVQENSKITVCEYCGTQQTVPSTDDEKRANLFNRANYFRQNSEFDKAIGIYEHIIEEDGSDSEAYWSLALCRYGIEYVEDPATKERKPTVNRMQAQSILNDADYKMALEHADYSQKEIYEREAGIIAAIQKDILQIAEKEKPYDVFISYKERALDGYSRTKSSVLAQEIYNSLTKAGYRTFFSRISLEDKLGEEYEPYIYSALNSAKVMLVVATDKDEMTAPWVKNEWSRFLAMMREDKGKTLIPCFRDMYVDELPMEFGNLQGLDMSKIGFEQDLLRGVEKIIDKKEKNISGTASEAANERLERMLSNAETYMKLDNYNEAYGEYKKITQEYTSDYRAWWGLIRAVTHDLSEWFPFDDRRREDLNRFFLYVKKLASQKDFEKMFEKYTKYLKEVSHEDMCVEGKTVRVLWNIFNQNDENVKNVITRLENEKAFILKNLNEKDSTMKENIENCKKKVSGIAKKQKMSKVKANICLALILITLLTGVALAVISIMKSTQALIAILAGFVFLCMWGMYWGIADKCSERIKESENQLNSLISDRQAFVDQETNKISILNNKIQCNMKLSMDIMQGEIDYGDYIVTNEDVRKMYFQSINIEKVGSAEERNKDFEKARAIVLRRNGFINARQVVIDNNVDWSVTCFEEPDDDRDVHFEEYKLKDIYKKISDEIDRKYISQLQN